jgi:hypothetical protein
MQKVLGRIFQDITETTFFGSVLEILRKITKDMTLKS